MAAARHGTAALEGEVSRSRGPRGEGAGRAQSGAQATVGGPAHLLEGAQIDWPGKGWAPLGRCVLGSLGSGCLPPPAIPAPGQPESRTALCRPFAESDESHWPSQKTHKCSPTYSSAIPGYSWRDALDLRK